MPFVLLFESAFDFKNRIQVDRLYWKESARHSVSGKQQRHTQAHTKRENNETKQKRFSLSE